MSPSWRRFPRLQRLIDLVCKFCALVGMNVSLAKIKVMVFNIAFPGPLQWTCGGYQLEVVVDFKYLGILSNALHGMAVTFPMLKKNMFGAWALLKRQYGRLQCLASVGLMFRVYEACVPPTAARSGVSNNFQSRTVTLGWSWPPAISKCLRRSLVSGQHFSRHSLGRARLEVPAACLALTGCQLLE